MDRHAAQYVPKACRRRSALPGGQFPCMLRKSDGERQLLPDRAHRGVLCERCDGKLGRSRAAVVVLALGTVGLAEHGAGAASANDPGVTDKQITIGYIYSGTGVAASTSKNGGEACKARVDRQNAQGGVNGRKINTITIDDQSSGANLTAAQDLVNNRNAFVVVDDSAFAFLSYRFLLGQGVPMIGGGYDGDYYGKPGNQSIFSALGTPFTGLTSDSGIRIMKKLGVTKTAAVG